MVIPYSNRKDLTLFSLGDTKISMVLGGLNEQSNNSENNVSDY